VFYDCLCFVGEWLAARMPWYSKLFINVEVEAEFYQVDNVAVLALAYKNPLLIIAGENYQQAPVTLSRRLFDICQSPSKQLIVVKNASHSTMLDEAKEIVLYQKFLASL
tara:strand:+ start:331 stop:657 length:327 start_codon:yes stop_codon:yes gene_type:complete